MSAAAPGAKFRGCAGTQRVLDGPFAESKEVIAVKDSERLRGVPGHGRAARTPAPGQAALPAARAAGISYAATIRRGRMKLRWAGRPNRRDG